MHCSVMAEDAVRAAIHDYLVKKGRAPAEEIKASKKTLKILQDEDT